MLRIDRASQELEAIRRCAVNEIEFVPEERWASMPVQPSAGALRARRRWVGVFMAAVSAWAIGVAATVVLGAGGSLRVWDPLGPLVLLGVLGIVMSIRQARAQRDEIARGYTTLRGRG